MSEDVLLGLASIIVLGIGAQWLAWRFRIPSILLLLVFGFLAGPITGFLDPDALFGRDMIGPIVSLSVGIILFEGGLSLRLIELREIGKTVRNLITIGVLITWALTTVAAYYIAGFNLSLSILIGAVLVVTGPTVVVPLLRHVRPSGRIGATARWEGIMNDPIGAILAVLVLEAILLFHETVRPERGGADIGAALGHSLEGLFEILLVSVGAAVVGAIILIILLRRRLVPDYLQNSVALMMVVAVFAMSNFLQEESGLLATTLMGIALANQPYASLRRIAAYKEDLRVLLIGGLFILLSARLEPSTIRLITTASILFVAALIFVVRPIAVFVSSMGAEIDWKEQVFLTWLAPRGIVAAAVASLFSLRLQEIYPEQAEAMVALVFLVIATTVALYGSTLTPLARWLGLAKPDPQGVLFVGSGGWVQDMALALREHDIDVLLTDTNTANVREAREKDLPAKSVNVLSATAMDELDLGGIGYALAVTPNDEVNSLAALHLADVLGSTNVYQLSASTKGDDDSEVMPQHLRGLPLFGGAETHRSLTQRFSGDYVIKSVEIVEEESNGSDESPVPENAIGLFLIGESGKLKICSDDLSSMLEPGQTLIALVPGNSKGREKD